MDNLSYIVKLLQSQSPDKLIGLSIGEGTGADQVRMYSWDCKSFKEFLGSEKRELVMVVVDTKKDEDMETQTVCLYEGQDVGSDADILRAYRVNDDFFYVIHPEGYVEMLNQSFFEAEAFLKMMNELN